MSNRAASEKIATSIDDWLKAEVVISGDSRNRYLDGSDEDKEKAQKNFEDLRRRVKLPYDDDKNWNANKDRSHQGRWPQWLTEYEAAPTHDVAAAQVGFVPLMAVSGAYRLQCLLEAEDQQDYLQRRVSGIGVDIEQAVQERVQEIVFRGRFSGAQITFEALRQNIANAYAQGEKVFRNLSEELVPERDYGVEDTVFTESLKNTQVSHLHVAVDAVALAAKNRGGDLAAVPFLEPVSISDQSKQMHYPLRERVDWLAVLS